MMVTDLVAVLLFKLNMVAMLLSLKSPSCSALSPTPLFYSFPSIPNLLIAAIYNPLTRNQHLLDTNLNLTLLAHFPILMVIIMVIIYIRAHKSVTIPISDCASGRIKIMLRSLGPQSPLTIILILLLILLSPATIPYRMHTALND